MQILLSINNIGEVSLEDDFRIQKFREQKLGEVAIVASGTHASSQEIASALNISRSSNWMHFVKC